MENTLLLATIIGLRKNGLHNLFFTERQNLFNAKFNSNFILRGTNLQASALKDHDASRCHNQAVLEKEHK